MNPYSINHCQFFKLKAESSGGALYLNVNKMDLVLILNSYFCECVAPNEGGAVYSNAKNTTTIMCCFLCCATESFVPDCWGTASKIVNSVGSLTSQVTIYRCNPDKDVFKGHTAFAISGGNNRIEYTNLTKCECPSRLEGILVVYSQNSEIRFFLGVGNIDYCTLHSKDSNMLDIENCIFQNNSDSIGAISVSTQTVLTSCIFGFNSLDIGSGSVTLKNCSTSSDSFGPYVQTDSECNINVNISANLAQFKIKGMCEPGVLFHLDCTNKIGSPRFALSFLSLLL